jgi:hypothetical protein
MSSFFDDLTWTCHVCKKTRPDAAISVYKVDISATHGLPPGTMQQNIRYCNDNPECIANVETQVMGKSK